MDQTDFFRIINSSIKKQTQSKSEWYHFLIRKTKQRAIEQLKDPLTPPPSPLEELGFNGNGYVFVGDGCTSPSISFVDSSHSFAIPTPVRSMDIQHSTTDDTIADTTLNTTANTLDSNQSQPHSTDDCTNTPNPSSPPPSETGITWNEGIFDLNEFLTNNLLFVDESPFVDTNQPIQVKPNLKSNSRVRIGKKTKRPSKLAYCK